MYVRAGQNDLISPKFFLHFTLVVSTSMGNSKIKTVNRIFAPIRIVFAILINSHMSDQAQNCLTFDLHNYKDKEINY